MSVLATLFFSTASAQMFYVEPQIRLGAGVSWIDGSLGASLSMDTRMTQLIYMSIGTFQSIQKSDLKPDRENVQTWTALRSGIWAAPGLRFPHRYKKKSINWDLLLRTGFACIFADLAEEEDWTLMEPAALGGGDFILFKDRFSVKFSGKIFIYNPYIQEFREKAVFYRPQLALEFSYQW